MTVPTLSAPVSSRHICRILFVIWLLVLFLPTDAIAQQSTPPKRVVVLYWYDKDYPWNAKFDQGFENVLRASTSGRQVEYHAEYLETNRFPRAQVYSLLPDYLKRKYADEAPDVVVATSDASLDFLLKYRSELFPRAPIVFVAINRPTTEEMAKDGGMTGIVSINAYRKTLDLALKLHPDSERVFIVSGTLEHDKRIETLARAELESYPGKVEINYLTDVPPNELIGTTQSLPERSLILYVWQQYQNPEGRVIESMDILGSIAQSASVPVYRLSTPSYEGSGVVGGYINTADANGAKIAEILLRILSGTRVQDIGVESAPTVPEFDWRGLQRWRLSESDLPPGSVVDFRKVTFWSQYRGRIIAVIAVIVVQALLIAGLLFQRAKRWRANRQLAESEQQFSKAFRANPQPMSITTLKEGRYLDVNESFLRMSGHTREEVVGYSSSELNNFEVLEDRQRLLVEPLLKYGGLRNFELKFRRKDGGFRTLLSSAELIELNKQKCILVASSDITERKESEHILAELTGRLLRTQDEERRHIARELHDVTAQSIGLILLNLAQVQSVAATMDIKSKDRLAESVALGEQALKEIRTLSYILHPPLLDQAGLVTALKWYLKGFSERSGVKVGFTEEGDDGRRMPPDVEYALFRVVQECLTNIRRHTNSETADVRVKRTAEKVLLIIQDRGKSQDLELPRNRDGIESIGVGIAGMRHRLKQLGGELSVETDPGGTTVTATVPVR